MNRQSLAALSQALQPLQQAINALVEAGYYAGIAKDKNADDEITALHGRVAAVRERIEELTERGK